MAFNEKENNHFADFLIDKKNLYYLRVVLERMVMKCWHDARFEGTFRTAEVA